jgi:hypothetical protein
MIEVVGFDNQGDYAPQNSVLRQAHDHELEGKLILSSDFKGWNISENFITARNLGHDPYEFGYAAGGSRALVLAASPHPCSFCPENFLSVPSSTADCEQLGTPRSPVHPTTPPPSSDGSFRPEPRSAFRLASGSTTTAIVSCCAGVFRTKSRKSESICGEFSGERIRQIPIGLARNRFCNGSRSFRSEK